jgi:hypothetical protein
MLCEENLETFLDYHGPSRGFIASARVAALVGPALGYVNNAKTARVQQVRFDAVYENMDMLVRAFIGAAKREPDTYTYCESTSLAVT